MQRAGYKAPNESKLNAKVVVELNKLSNTLVRKRHAGPHRKGLPDITGVSHGYLVELEGKMPGNVPTEKQEQWLKKFDALGAITGVFYSPEEAVEIVKSALRERFLGN